MVLLFSVFYIVFYKGGCGRWLNVLLVKWDDFFSIVVLWVDGVWWMDELGI